MNPLELMQIKDRALGFKESHPKFINFLRAASHRNLTEGTLMEVSITPPGGETLSANLRLTASDIELIRSLSELEKK